VNKQELLKKVCGNKAARNAILSDADLNEAVSGGFMFQHIDKGGQGENGCWKCIVGGVIGYAVLMPR